MAFKVFFSKKRNTKRELDRSLVDGIFDCMNEINSIETPPCKVAGFSKVEMFRELPNPV